MFRFMPLTENLQVEKLIAKAHNILLVVPPNAHYDAIASMIALYLALERMEKTEVDIVSPSHVPEALQFLPGGSQVSTQPNCDPEIVLDIAGPEEVTGVRLEKLVGGSRVHVKVPHGHDITMDRIGTTIRTMPYDLVITLGCSDIEALGEIFMDHTDFFYQTPVINIDNTASNENFGTVNLVDLTAGSIAEVINNLLKDLSKEEINNDIATALYAGIIAGTDSFQRPGTTPRSFEASAKLLQAGAERELVVQHLVKTKPLALLKLSGRIYARLRYHQEARLFWSIVRDIDFQESGSTAQDLPKAIVELSHNIAGFTLAFVLQEAGPGQFKIYSMLGSGLMSQQHEIKEQLKAREEQGLLITELEANSLEQAENQALEMMHSILPSYREEEPLNVRI